MKEEQPCRPKLKVTTVLLCGFVLLAVAACGGDGAKVADLQERLAAEEEARQKAEEEAAAAERKRQEENRRERGPKRRPPQPS